MSRDQEPCARIRAKLRGQSWPVGVSFDSDANERKGARMRSGRFCKVARQSRTFGALRALRGRLRSSRYLFGKGIVEHKEAIHLFSFWLLGPSRFSDFSVSRLRKSASVSDSRWRKVYAS
jgi:hypothetical protein